ncbi:MAG: patatin-like phospholipase family protein [Chitinophagales bacterium]
MNTKQLKKILKGLYYSFPFQLLIVHLKHGKALLLFWLLLFGFVTGSVGKYVGMTYLFLDPEYLDVVNFMGFFWMGISFGLFVITWNIASYMMHSSRFPFLATLYSPFLHFCLNNSLIPLTFIGVYMWNVSNFQETKEFKQVTAIFTYFEGFVVGLIVMILLAALYFGFTNKNVSNFIKAKLKKQDFKKDIKGEIKNENQTNIQSDLFKNKWYIRYYLTQKFKIRAVRKATHYTHQSLKTVFEQNHANAFFVQMITLLVMFALGFMMDVSWFQIPAGASVLLLLTVLLSILGAFTYWLIEWRSVGFLSALVILNFFTSYKWLNYDTPAYGLNYETKAAIYTNEKIEQLSNDKQIATDLKHSTQILENWKKRVVKQNPKNDCPNMVLLNFSGGGLRAGVWSMWVMQHLDSLFRGEIMQHTTLMTGASGGMLAATYMRELYYRQQKGEKIKLHDKFYLQSLSQDYTNAMAFSIAVNDLFYPFHTFKVGENKYKKNRAYAFENEWNENTQGLLKDKTIGDYQQAEFEAKIPMLIFSPTIINDNRKLFISSQPVSYLTRPFNKYGFTYPSFEVDGIDFRQFFAEQEADNLLISSAIRMNATFPYILPETVLPSEPPMQVMDAGFRDNFGFENTFRFLAAHRNWIKENVNDVVMLVIRYDEKELEVTYNTETLLAKMFKPLSVFMASNLQDNYFDYCATMTDDLLEGKLELLTFEYVPTQKEREASMSFHLTGLEKQDIMKAIENKKNKAKIEHLQNLMLRK